MAEQIACKRHADFRYWYDLPSGETYGILEDYFGSVVFAGITYQQQATKDGAVLKAQGE